MDNNINTVTANTVTNSAEAFAKATNEERAKILLAINEKADTTIAGLARATAASEVAAEQATAARGAAEQAALYSAAILETVQPIQPTGWFSNTIIGVNRWLDKALMVIKPVAAVAAVGAGAYVGGKYVYGAVTGRKAASAATAAPAPTAPAPGPNAFGG
jgi:hypothetical protein